MKRNDRVRYRLWPYSGSKHRMSHRLYGLFPPHKRFVDVFGGTGIVLARKPRSMEEVYCEVDRYCHNALTVVKHEGGCKALVRRLEQTRDDREQYFYCRRLLRNQQAGPVTRAWAFLVCGALGFPGHPAIRKHWMPPDGQKKRLANLPEEVVRWHRRLAGVPILNLPWEKTLAHFDSPDTLFFIDPPYPDAVLASSPNTYYFHTMTIADHMVLLDALQNIRGCAVVCGYNHPLYTERLFHWQKSTFPERNQMQSRRHEQVWRNCDDQGRKITNDPQWIKSRFIDIMGDADTAALLLNRTGQLMQLAHQERS